MAKTPLALKKNRRTRSSSCIDQVVGDILSGWRYDISGLSPTMRTDYEQHLADCGRCRHRQQVARTTDVLLLCVSTLSIGAFLLAAFVIHRVEVVSHHLETLTHIGAMHVQLHRTPVAISLEAVAVTGLVLSTLLWILVAITTPLPGFLGGLLQERLPADLRERFHKGAA